MALLGDLLEELRAATLPTGSRGAAWHTSRAATSVGIRTRIRCSISYLLATQFSHLQTSSNPLCLHDDRGGGGRIHCCLILGQPAPGDIQDQIRVCFLAVSALLCSSVGLPYKLSIAHLPRSA